jgi:hypothetical protein
MANFVYDYGKFLLANGGVNLLTANLVVVLMANTYINGGTPSTGVANNKSNVHSEVSSYEITTGTVSGYARQVLGTKSVAEDDPNGFAYLKAANTTFTGLGTGNTIGGAVIIVDTGVNTTSSLIAFFDVTDTPTNGGDITIQWALTTGLQRPVVHSISHFRN